MVKNRSLKAALDRQKGVDHQKEHQKKLQKQAEKKKSKQQRGEIDISALEAAIASAEAEDEAHRLANSSTEKQRENIAANGASLRLKGDGEGDGWETDESSEAEDDEDDDEEGGINLETFEDESVTESDDDETFYTAAASSPQKKQVDGRAEEEGDEEDEEDDGDEDEEEEDVPLSDIESLASEDKGDIIPHQRLTINNTAALQRSLKSIALPSSLPFSEFQAVTSAAPTQIPDIEDDLNRETAFYGQCLAAVREARIQLKKEGVPFSRPADYFAEMVKSEEQMGKVRSKQLDEAARKKASADARRQRDLKKFGKAVQVAKLQERDRAKRNTLDKIGALKRKRASGAELTANEDDLFDVAIEDAAESEKADRAARRSKGDRGKGGSREGPNHKRQKKDEKFGFGGKKRFKKSNDAESAGRMDGYSARKMKGGAKAAKRPGKSRRARMN